MAKSPATELNLKQQRFVAAYQADPDANGTRAAIAAGYSRRHAADAAHRLLHTPLVKAAVDRARQELADRGSFNADAAMRRLDDAAQFARTTENATALARCIELQLRLHGLLIDKAQIQVEHIDIAGTLIEARKRVNFPTIHEAEYEEVPPQPV